MMNRYSFLIPLSILVAIAGCRPERGCMDPTADNYSVNAEKDDGTCIPAREKLIGDYTYTKVYVDVRDTTDTEIISTGELTISESNTGANDFVMVMYDQAFGPPLVIHGIVEANDLTFSETVVNQDVPFAHLYDELNPEVYVDTLFLWARKFNTTGQWLEADSVDSWITVSTTWFDVDTPYVPSLLTIPQDITYFLTKVEE